MIRFLSTPSARRATLKELHRKLEEEQFLSTPSARRATTRRAETATQQAISIHTLREEGDTDVLEEMVASVIFLSTPSARRATNADA